MNAELVPLGAAAEIVGRTHAVLARTSTAAGAGQLLASRRFAGTGAAAVAATAVVGTGLRTQLIPLRVAAKIVDAANAVLAIASSASGRIRRLAAAAGLHGAATAAAAVLVAGLGT